jgi:uncharacterized protein YcbX
MTLRLTGLTIYPIKSARGIPRVSFADGFPFLLISEESPADLNRRLVQSLR